MLLLGSFVLKCFKYPVPTTGLKLLAFSLPNLLLNHPVALGGPLMCAGDMSSSVSVSGACLVVAATDADGDGVWRVSSLATLGAITSESRVMYAYGLLLHIGNTVTVG